MLKKTIITATVLSLLVGAVAFAQTTLPPSPVQNISDVTRVLNTFLNWMFTIFLILAVIFIVWAAFLYLTAGGDAEKIGSAHKQLIYAAIAIGVALLSRGVQPLVENLLR